MNWEKILPHGITVLLIVLAVVSIVGGILTHIAEEERSAMRKEEFDQQAE